MFHSGFPNRLYAGLIVLLMFALGCGKTPQPADKADRNVEAFLDAWSRGEPSDKFADADGPVQGTDPDWTAGYRLLSFLSSESKQSPETPDHVRCRVALSLQDKKGKRYDKEVVYDVQLGEKSIIRRIAP